MRFVRGHSSFRHGAKRRGQQTPEYVIYTAAKSRCSNPNHKAWPYYGGRGIKFLFTSFEQFLAALGARPASLTLDRINNDGNYEPRNVRWATWSEQANNRRKAREEV